MRRWEPSRLIVSPPCEGIELRLMDDAVPLELSFEVHDAETGDEIERFGVLWSFADGTSRSSDTQRSRRYALRGVTPDQPLRWRIIAPGYQPAFGDESAFTHSVEPRKGRLLDLELRRALVLLRRGWGVRLIVKGPDSKPISGATVEVDGARAGTTGPDGTLVLTADAAPEQITVMHDNLAPGVIDVGRGDLAPFWGEAEVQISAR